MPARRRSELECFVLGLVWQVGPASPYDIRRHMQESPSTQWSASAGAIYPLVRRLQRAGLLSSEAKRDGKRRRREYRITVKGLGVLRAWIGPPIGAEAVTVAHDPLRSRARFLEALSEADRAAWFLAARAALDEVERRVNQWAAAHGALSRAARVMTRSGELDVESRRRWLEEASDAGG
ncbi:MAG: PadR family transcriptional regulator [Phycisphaerae bacterium]|nr:PadR family transcriptional regulator [Phycisphaerae bacterium]